MAKPRIVLGLYTGVSTPSSFAVNYGSLVERLSTQGMYAGHIKREGSRIDSNRNYLIGYFLKDFTQADYLFIIDQDMRHPPLMPEILASREKPIISGLYFRRDYNGEHAPVLYRHSGVGQDNRIGHGQAFNDRFDYITPVVMEFLRAYQAPDHDEPLVFGNPDQSWPLLESSSPSPVVRIDASGFGCLLLRRDALEQMDAPYLISEPGLNGDLVFGRNAMRKGIEYWADLSVVASHLHEQWLGISAFSRYCWQLDRMMREQYPEHYTAAAADGALVKPVSGMVLT